MAMEGGGVRDERGDAIPISGRVTLPPDPRAIDALGRNHTLEAAVAELIDNSIDAGARRATVRFVRDDQRLKRLLIIDDGAGMDGEAIDLALTLGGRRSYEDGEIGRFGLGLQAASLSQARILTVLSRAQEGTAHGRRWDTERMREDYSCEVVSEPYARQELDRDWGFPRSSTGTIVSWERVTGFPEHDDAEHFESFLHDARMRLLTHLGLVFHRLIGTRIALRIEVEQDGEVQLGNAIEPLDPFGYRHSGALGWPQAIEIGDGERSLTLSCHIWPGKSSLPEFRLDGDSQARQGIYVYYNDRLIQQGGWNGLRPLDRRLNLARVALEIAGDVDRMVRIKPEKNGIEVGPDFARAVFAAEDDGIRRFDTYLERARGVLRTANRANRDRPEMMPPGTGFDPRFRTVVAQEVTLKSEDPVSIRWRRLSDDEFFRVDRVEQILWLNQRHRQTLLGGRRVSLNDLQVLKALLFLLMQEIFAGQILGPRDRDNLALWQALLTAAVEAETAG